MWNHITVSIFLFGFALCLPSFEKRAIGPADPPNVGTYTAPSPNDSRGPCPALNTLANHGLINSNGRNLLSNDIIKAFAQGFGIAQDGIATALKNFQIVCQYTTGTQCLNGDGQFLLANLTLLGEPHAFEHDHSFSRLDYFEQFARNTPANNIYFNSSEFQQSLNVIGYTPSNPPTQKLIAPQAFQQIRAQRESQKYAGDSPGGFQQNAPVQLFEVGFIFGAMFDRFPSGQMRGSPMVRVDWWNFWFSEESFPTQLGWAPADTAVFNLAFITSISSAVYAAALTTTPAHMPPQFTSSPSAAGTLPASDTVPVLPLYQATPYVAPTAPSNIATPRSSGLQPQGTGGGSANNRKLARAVQRDIVREAVSIAGPVPTPYDFYREVVNIGSLKAQVSAFTSYQSAVASVVSAML